MASKPLTLEQFEAIRDRLHESGHAVDLEAAAALTALVAAMGEVATESVELVRQQAARIAALEAELVKAKLKSMEYAEKLGELQGTSVLIASGEIDRLRSELALRDRLEAAGIAVAFDRYAGKWTVCRQYVFGTAWSSRGSDKLVYDTADAARAAAMRLLEGDAT